VSPINADFDDHFERGDQAAGCAKHLMACEGLVFIFPT